MINISHPKISWKPPAKNIVAKKRGVAKEHHAAFQRKDDPFGPTSGQKPEERDRNVVESSASSIEQLCSMISDLENGMIGGAPEIHQLQLEPEKDESGRKHEFVGATYDEIMSFLAKLEEDSRMDEIKMDVPDVEATLLGEIFGEPPDALPPCDGRGDSGSPANIDREISRTFRNTFAASQLELEEKTAAISVLKEQLKSERKVACEKLCAQKKSSASKLHQLEEKYKGIVARHQKFIEQLISEKTDLTEKCTSLVQRVTEIEAKMQRDLKVAADRHAVELQKAKEHFAAAEKIKRERWIESRTAKIKEMTVKGLEPELRIMAEQHAEEIQKLRDARAKELQDAELQIVRRSNEQLEQLRLELTASHERVLAHERNSLRTSYQERLAEQENRFKEKETQLVRELEYSADKFSKEQAKRDTEWEAKLQRMHSQWQQATETLKQQHSNEKKALQESLKTEWEMWFAEYKKQQNSRMEQMESRVKDESTRERDRQIELVIDRLERDIRATKLTLQRNFDCKLRCFKEEFDVELQAAKSNEQLHKNKLIQTMDKLGQAEMQLHQTEKRLQDCTTELSNATEIVKRLNVQRDGAKKLARQEIESEKRKLEEKIASLYQEITRINANRDNSMAQLHSRIKLVVTQKMLTIKSLNKELSDAKAKCEHLEKLVDQQRREYILNGI